MGAELWYHFSGRHDSPLDALREIQAEALASYDLQTLIEQHLDSAQGAVAATEADDEYGLLDFYRGELSKMEEIAAAGVPDKVDERIALVRRIYDSSGQGIGNVLDVTDVSDVGGTHVARPYTRDDLIDLGGTDRPTLTECEQLIGPINERLDRGESVCFRVYSDDRSTSVGWCFVGNTVD